MNNVSAPPEKSAFALSHGSMGIKFHDRIINHRLDFYHNSKLDSRWVVPISLHSSSFCSQLMHRLDWVETWYRPFGVQGKLSERHSPQQLHNNLSGVNKSARSQRAVRVCSERTESTTVCKRKSFDKTNQQVRHRTQHSAIKVLRALIFSSDENNRLIIILLFGAAGSENRFGLCVLYFLLARRKEFRDGGVCFDFTARKWQKRSDPEIMNVYQRLIHSSEL